MSSNIELYAFRDRKFGFLSPFTDLNDDFALQHFVSLLIHSDDDVDFQQAIKGLPLSDLELWHLGSYDLSSGVLHPLGGPILIAQADAIYSKHHVDAVDVDDSDSEVAPDET